MSEGTLKVIKYPRAVIDITEAALYLSEHAGLEVAIRFIDLCDEAFSKLAAAPGIGAPRNVSGFPGLRSWRLQPHPHMVVYRTRENAVEIIRVLHGVRDIDAILRAPSSDD